MTVNLTPSIRKLKLKTNLDAITRVFQISPLTESRAFGVTVMSRIGSHISVVENDVDLEFSSNCLASRKKVTDPMFL